MITVQTFCDNLEGVKESIARAAQKSGRSDSEIEIMAVTKTHPLSAAAAACKGGITLLGENRVQEAVEKYQVALQGQASEIKPFAATLRLHLIGHLQRNKAKRAVQTFCCIQSIDKLETAQAVNRHCLDLGTKMDVFLEVNTAQEADKFGFKDDRVFFESLEAILELENIEVRGLMTVGPFVTDEKRIRRAFAGLRTLFDKTSQRYRELNLDTLSMGMSNDFALAVQEGATMLRLGTALFGKRD
jgi:hypothetical protein